MDTARYFKSNGYWPPALLRRVGFVDQAFVAGVWRATTSIVDWMAGEDDYVEEIDVGEALDFAPEAFTGVTA